MFIDPIALHLGPIQVHWYGIIIATAVLAGALLGTLEARFDVVNVLDKNYVLRDGTGIGVFARQFGPPRGFFGGLKKEF